jgi:hypothetical protein
MTRQIARGYKSEPQKLDAPRDLKPDTGHPKPNIPILQYASIPDYLLVAKPKKRNNARQR